MRSKGTPARAVLAGGVSRHADRINAAIDEAFAPLRDLLAERLEHVGDSWSPAQHGRRAQ